METKRKIHRQAVKQLAQGGYEGVSLRSIANGAGIAPSVVYYYYDDKDALLKSMFRQASRDLGVKRKKLRKTKSTKTMLTQRVEFQIDHAEEIVAILKFFLARRDLFPKVRGGYVPLKTYQHIEEVLEYGIKNDELRKMEIEKEAKIITHAINGFVLEFYPNTPKRKEKKQLVENITNFIWQAIKK